MEETLSKQELTDLVERTIDRRMEVWLTQLMDALIGASEQEIELKPDFAASLRRSLEQSRSGQGMDLETFREETKR